MIIRVRDKNSERDFELSRRVTTVGCKVACHLQVQGQGVAENHAVIYLEPAGYRISLVDERASLFVNDQEVEDHLLQVGDRLGIGAVNITILSDEKNKSLSKKDDRENEKKPINQVVNALVEQLESFSQSVLAQEPWPRPAEVLLESLSKTTGADQAFLIVLNPFKEGQEEWRVVSSKSDNVDLDKQQELLSDSIVNEVLRSKKPVLLDNALAESVYGQAPSVVQLNLHSVICAPLIVGDHILGAIYLGNSQVDKLFGQKDLDLMRIYCAQAALLLENARHIETLRGTLWDLRHQLDQLAQQEFLAQSIQMDSVLQMVARVAPTEVTVLLQGETGTGKELLARMIHNVSPRAKGPFVAINCGALPSELLESELFGHIKGAFTGASKDRQGLIEAANGGTLFLDEIGEMSPPLQVKLLRTLQQREIRRVGDTKDRHVDVRIIAATNRDLDHDDNFRQDMYFRIAELVIDVPPLRKRGRDIDLLVRYFLNRYCNEFRRPHMRLTQRAWNAIRKHDWPGNIRELQNRLKRAVLLTEGSEITEEDLSLSSVSQVDGDRFEPLTIARDRFVADYVQCALDHTGGDRERAAQMLDIGLRSLYRYLKIGQQD